jgi:glucose-6-phosphate 1-dehydrogenase
MPALYNLKRGGLLPEQFALIGVSHHEESDESFRDGLGTALQEYAGGQATPEDWRWFAERMHYVRAEFDDPAAYETLRDVLSTVERAHHTGGNCLFYLATSPTVFATIARCLGAAGLLREDAQTWRRVVVEKPFGHDLPSAQLLNRDLLDVLAEQQIYRIDHYLGKETVQNVMVLRFANGIFEPLWNREHIDHVQITVAETVGVEGRGKFYDATGALRDMVPNHLFQLLTFVAMEPPSCFGADALRSEKVKVLDAVHNLDGGAAEANVIRAQYGEGQIGSRTVAAYRRERNVAANSVTETYVAMKLMIDNWRWAGVPFYLRTGKALAQKRTEISIQFKQAPLALFRDTPVERLTPNQLTLHIQPDEGVSLRFGAKIPGPSVRIGGVRMNFDYEDYFNATASTGYETLIYDCMIGDAMLFQRADNIEGGWRVVQPVLDDWARDRPASLPVYAAGSMGPSEADALLMRDGRSWRPLGGDGAGKLR